MLLNLSPQLLGVFTPFLKASLQIRYKRVEDASPFTMRVAFRKSGCIVVFTNGRRMTGKFLSKLSDIPTLLPQRLHLLIKGEAFMALLRRCRSFAVGANEGRSFLAQSGL